MMGSGLSGVVRGQMWVGPLESRKPPFRKMTEKLTIKIIRRVSKR